MRERRNHLTLVGLIVAALIGVALIAVPGSPFHRGATLGLDLQGGLEVVLKAIPPKGSELTEEDLDRSVNIMRNRIDKLGVAEPELRKQGSDEIVIQLAGVTDPEKAAELIGKTAQLELFDLEQDLIGPSTGAQGAVATSRLFELLGGKGGSAPDDASAYYLFGKNGQRAGGTGEHAAGAVHEAASAGPQGRQGARRAEAAPSSSPAPRQRSRRVLRTSRRAGRTTTSSATSRTTRRTRCPR